MCEKTKKLFPNQKIKFINADIGSPIELNLIIDKLTKIKIPNINIYCRFFLHAVSEEIQNDLLINLKKFSKKIPINLFLEFRTTKDEKLSKETEKHFRRYIEPSNIIKSATKIGYKLNYNVEGFGFAKYLNDDAYVARIIFSHFE